MLIFSLRVFNLLRHLTTFTNNGRLLWNLGNMENAISRVCDDVVLPFRPIRVKGEVVHIRNSTPCFLHHIQGVRVHISCFLQTKEVLHFLDLLLHGGCRPHTSYWRPVVSQIQTVKPLEVILLRWRVEIWTLRTRCVKCKAGFY